MSFHPDENLPNCMMYDPDGGECCAGHAAVCEDWHKQRARIEALEAQLQDNSERYGNKIADRIEALEAALRKIEDLVDSEAGEPLDDAIEIARAALAPEQKP